MVGFSPQDCTELHRFLTDSRLTQGIICGAFSPQIAQELHRFFTDLLPTQDV